MNWEKSVFSYILWLVYTLAVCVGAYSIANSFCQAGGYSTGYAILMVIGCILVTAGIVFGIHKLCRKLNRLDKLSEIKKSVGMAEGIYVFAVLMIGFGLRMMQMLNVADTVEGRQYFESALVYDGWNLNVATHDASSLYILLLHGALVFLGNRLVVAVGVQVVVQLFASIMFYLAVRKIAGTLASTVTIAFLMLSPYMIAESVKLSPTYLYLMLYALVLLFAGRIFEYNYSDFRWYLVVGALVGVLTYLEIVGATIFLFLIAGLAIKRDYYDDFISTKILTFLVEIIGGALGFGAMLLADVCVSGKDFGFIMLVWWEKFCPRDMLPISVIELCGTLADGVILFVLLILGVFSFLSRKYYERSNVWFVPTMALVLLQSYQMLSNMENAKVYIYIFLTVLAGISVETMFIVEHYTVYKEDPIGNVLNFDFRLPTFNVSTSRPTRTKQSSVPPRRETVSMIERYMGNGAKNTENIEFLENPLPLPKRYKHEKPDYQLTDLQDENEFDYVSSQDYDDYDI